MTLNGPSSPLVVSSGDGLRESVEAPILIGADSQTSHVWTTVPVFSEHHALIEALWPGGLAHGTPVAGIKKDVVLTPRLGDEPGRVAIYGWHWQDGSPIQPVYTGHTDRWVDYSHGIRLVPRRVLVDGVEHDLVDLLEDPELRQLGSDEGPMRFARYPTATR